MKDRGGAEYTPVWERVHSADDFRSDVEAQIGNVRPVAWRSPTRQAEKALGLSGRQLRKYRKAARRQRAGALA